MGGQLLILQLQSKLLTVDSSNFLFNEEETWLFYSSTSQIKLERRELNLQDIEIFVGKNPREMPGRFLITRGMKFWNSCLVKRAVTGESSKGNLVNFCGDYSMCFPDCSELSEPQCRSHGPCPFKFFLAGCAQVTLEILYFQHLSFSFVIRYDSNRKMRVTAVANPSVPN